MRRRFHRLAWLPLVGLVAWWVLVPQPALAHAELVRAEPRPNASLVDAPEAIILRFSEAIDPANVIVDILDARLRPVEGVAAAVLDADGLGVQVDLPVLEPGAYSVSYQVVSTLDGHATAGRFAFVVDPSGAQAPPAGGLVSSSPSVDPWSVAARWVALLAALVAFGGISLWWSAGRQALRGAGPDVSDRPPWHLIGAASFATLGGLVAYLWLAARPIAAGAAGGFALDVAAPFGWTPFAIAMRVALLACLLATAAAAMFATRRAGGRAAAVVAILLAIALAAMSAAGHAASLGGPSAAMLDWLHLVAAAAWLGGLPAAWTLARRRPGIGRSILRGHGRVALVAGPLVVLTGLANSPVVIGEARELVAGPHGNLLLAKAGLASVALGIGAANHLLLRGRGRGPLAALVGTELAVAVVAVMAAATMVTIQPGAARQPALTAPSVNPAHLFGEVGPSRIHLSVSVPAPGTQAYQVTVSDAERGGPRRDVQKVFLAFVPPPGGGIGAERVELEAREPSGLYAIGGAYTPVVGEWSLEVTVRRSGARDETIDFGLLVREPGPGTTTSPPDAGIGVPAPLGLLWSVLPTGLAGWVPGVAILAAVLVAGRGKIVAGRLASARIMMVGVAIVALLGAGSRSVVEGANRPSPAALAEHDLRTLAPSPERGERIYLANCAGCHGVDGDGRGPMPTVPAAGSLPGALAAMTDAEVSYRIANGLAGTPMPAFAATLGQQERRDLIAYLRQRWPLP